MDKSLSSLAEFVKDNEQNCHARENFGTDRNVEIKITITVCIYYSMRNNNALTRECGEIDEFF